MYISKLCLKDYRNIEYMEIPFNKGVNILYGDNAQGKTNILESVYMSALGRSHRTHIDKELIAFDKNEAHIQVFVEDNNFKDKIDIHLKKNNKKGIAINNIPIKKVGELFGYVYVVIFSPEDLSLIKNSPNNRRKFTDSFLSQISKVYYFNLSQYYKVLNQRNSLLKEIKINPSLKETIFLWDKQLIEFGSKLIEKREEFVKILNDESDKIYSEITQEKEKLNILYKKSTSIEKFEEKLKTSLERDMFLGSTTVGPHKDDLIYIINDKDLRVYGSQGQQKSSALASKLALVNIIKKIKGKNPILLLDDVFSELDNNRQNYLISLLQDNQTIITTTGIDNTIQKLSQKAKLYHIRNGKIIN